MFEDNAEFGFGMRLTIDKMREFALELIAKFFPKRLDEIANAPQTTPVEIEALRVKVESLKNELRKMDQFRCQAPAGDRRLSG